MSEPIETLSLYLHLAMAAWKQLRLSDRDRLFVLSARIAAEIELPTIAAYCRYLILQNNHGHMLKKWATVAMALEDDDFQVFLKQVHRRFPLEKAEIQLQELSIDRSHERDVYYTDEEYAASILGVKLESLWAQFGDGGSK